MKVVPQKPQTAKKPPTARKTGGSARTGGPVDYSPPAPPPPPRAGCYDTQDACTKWRDVGYCTANKQFMEHACRLSCGFCAAASDAPAAAAGELIEAPMLSAPPAQRYARLDGTAAVTDPAAVGPALGAAAGEGDGAAGWGRLEDRAPGDHEVAVDDEGEIVKDGVVLGPQRRRRLSRRLAGLPRREGSRRFE